MTEKKEEKSREPEKEIPRLVVIEIEGTTKVRLAKDDSASDFELVAILQFIIDWVQRGRK
jgi:hypothetical protein